MSAFDGGRQARRSASGCKLPTVLAADLEAAIRIGRPFVIRSHPGVLSLGDQFSLASLAKRLGGTKIEVEHRHRWIRRSRSVDAGHYLRHLKGSHYYWRHFLLQAFGLTPSLPVPGPLGINYFDYGWIGPKDCIQTFHQDNHDQFFVNHNLFIQISGKKRVALASPEDSGFFVSRPLVDGQERHSAALPWDEITRQQCTTLAETVLEPGDLLYIPPRYWHFMQSESTSISISRWWFTSRIAGLLYASEIQVDSSIVPEKTEICGDDWQRDLAEFGGKAEFDRFMGNKPLLHQLRFMLLLSRFYGEVIFDA